VDLLSLKVELEKKTICIFRKLLAEFILIKQDGLKGRDFKKRYYLNLSRCLEKGQFKEIEELIDNSLDLDFFIDPRKIPNRFEIISNLLLDCIQTLNLGEIFNILRFVNKFNLVDKDLNDSELEIVNNIKKNNLLIANLIDLFGNISNSFIIYVRKVMPFNLLYYYNNFFNEYSSYSNEGYDINLILNYLNEYNIYGLNVKSLGNLEDFFNSFKKKVINHHEKYIEFKFANKNHLVSPRILRRNYQKILSQEEYNFYSLSMVTLYGIGPQGFGFTFSTPKGEVIEICSDVKQNEAIVIKYKQFLTEQFIFKLKKDLLALKISDSIISDLRKYLLEILKSKKLINFYKKDFILQKINHFFDFNIDSMEMKNNIRKIIPEISKSITKILRPIKMIDQFKIRMDLIAENKLRSEDIAKLTSLKEKSNYDVLKERFFLQYIVDWFYQLYLEQNSNVNL